MTWTNLTTIHQLDEIDLLSKTESVLIFKDSTTCNISEVAHRRLKKSQSDNPAWVSIRAYYLYLLQYRAISNAISERYHVYHESPQVLLIKDGVCYFDCSHMDIDQGILLDQIQSEAENSKYALPSSI